MCSVRIMRIKCVALICVCDVYVVSGVPVVSGGPEMHDVHCVRDTGFVLCKKKPTLSQCIAVLLKTVY